MPGRKAREQWLLPCFTSWPDLCLAQPPSEKLPPVADGKKYRDPQPDHMQRVRDLGTLSSKRDVSIKSLPSELKEICWKRRQMECKIQREQRTKRNQSTKPSTHKTDAHMNFQRLATPTGSTEICTKQDCRVDRKSGHTNTPPLTEKPSLVNDHLQMKISFLQGSLTGENKPLLRVGPILSTRWPA